MDRQLYLEATRHFETGKETEVGQSLTDLLDRDYTEACRDDLLSAQGILIHRNEAAYDEIALRLLNASINSSDEMVRANCTILMSAAIRNPRYSAGTKEKLERWRIGLLEDPSTKVRNNALILLKRKQKGMSE